jgi:hypothetical protein
MLFHYPTLSALHLFAFPCPALLLPLPSCCPCSATPPFDQLEVSTLLASMACTSFFLGVKLPLKRRDQLCR